MKDYTWRELEPGNDIATCVSFLSRGAYFAIGDEDGTINIWSYVTFPVISKKLTLNKVTNCGQEGNFEILNNYCSGLKNIFAISIRIILIKFLFLFGVGPKILNSIRANHEG